MLRKNQDRQMQKESAEKTVWWLEEKRNEEYVLNQKRNYFMLVFYNWNRETGELSADRHFFENASLYCFYLLLY